MSGLHKKGQSDVHRDAAALTLGLYRREAAAHRDPDVELPLTRAEALYVLSLLQTEASQSTVPGLKHRAETLAARLARRMP